MKKIRALSKSKVTMYILLGLFCILLASISSSYDFSLFTNLMIGEHLVSTRDFIYKDLFSFTPTHIWINQQWIAGIFYHLFYKLFGVFGFVLSQAVLLFMTAYFIIKTQRIQKHAYPASIGFIGLFLVLFSLKNPELCNPIMFSYLFFAGFIYLLEKTRIKNSNLVWLLPIILVFWNNTHKGSILGLYLILAYMIGELVARNKTWFKYLGVLIVSIPMLLITPYGMDYLYFYPISNLIKIGLKGPKDLFLNNFTITDGIIVGTGLFSFILTITNILNTKKLNLTRLILFIITLTLGILNPEYISLLLIVITSLFYNDLVKLLSKTSVKTLEKLCIIIVGLSLLAIPFTHPLTAKIDQNKVPVVEAEFLKINKLEGNILSDLDFSRFFSYKLYPNSYVYMDSREGELYFKEFKEDYDEFENAAFMWFFPVVKNPVEIIIVKKDREVCKRIEEPDSGWKKIFSGPICNIYIIEQFETKTNYKQPDTNNEKNVFEKIGTFVEL